MLTTLTDRPATEGTSVPHGSRFTYIALGAILLLAVFLHFFRLDQEGFANLYYAATVQSMLTSWHNLFFASFDPGGFVTVDKPPLGLWIQAASAFVFGFNGVWLLLPQAIAGVLSVALLYRLVARVFGATAGLVAALVLAVTPISIAANRNNTMDSLLVFTSLLAAWAVSIAAERGKLRWLLVCAILVGIGFNIKMLQAYMVLPAFWLMYLIAARTAWWKRIAHLALATIVLGIVSFAWIAVFDLTPPDERPYAGSSQNNTMMELVVGHNGVSRLGAIANWLGLRRAPQLYPTQPQPSQSARPQNPPNAPPPNQPGLPPNLRGQPPPAQFKPPPNQPPLPSGQRGQMLPNQPPPQPRGPNDETGEPGILRLFNQQLAGQASWLLPLALFGILVLAVESVFTHHASRFTFHALLLWSIWLIPQIIFFSFAGLFHRYYLEMMSPAIAALVGAGIAAMWNDYRQDRWRGWLLPVAILVTAIGQAAMLLHFPDWGKWLIPTILGMTLIGIIGLIISRFFPALRLLPFNFCLLTLLIAPTAWSITPLVNGGDSGLPFAGPELLGRPHRGTNLPAESRLTDYLHANRNGAQYLVATINAQTAAPIMVATGEPVMALGGFTGNDRILTTDQLAARVANNDVRFFLMPVEWGQQPELLRWIRNNCEPAEFTPRNPNPVPGGQQLYDCARR
jgi:4-amino-4-deoxy-L-arabinose transferase-like glycosyltransferase